ncbi:MAG: hypothetical protein ACRCU5_06810 [Rhizobiaceae bacterium]
MANEFDAILEGQRPDSIPADWVGSPTQSAPGFRWDDPKGQNSVRFFKGDPNDTDATKRQPYVIVISDGKLMGRDGKPIVGAKAAD